MINQAGTLKGNAAINTAAEGKAAQNRKDHRKMIKHLRRKLDAVIFEQAMKMSPKGIHMQTNANANKPDTAAAAGKRIKMRH